MPGYDKYEFICSLTPSAGKQDPDRHPDFVENTGLHAKEIERESGKDNLACLASCAMRWHREIRKEEPTQTIALRRYPS